MLAVGVRCVRSRRSEIDPRNKRGIGRQRSLDFVQSRDPARQRAVILDELRVKLAQRDTCQLTLALQFFESLGSLSLVEILGCRFHQLVQPLEFAGQFAEAGSLIRCEPPVLTSGQLIEQTSAQVVLQPLPRLGWPAAPGQH